MKLLLKYNTNKKDLNKCNMIGICPHIQRESGSMVRYPIFLSKDLPEERLVHCWVTESVLLSLEVSYQLLLALDPTCLDGGSMQASGRPVLFPFLGPPVQGQVSWGSHRCFSQLAQVCTFGHCPPVEGAGARVVVGAAVREVVVSGGSIFVDFLVSL